MFPEKKRYALRGQGAVSILRKVTPEGDASGSSASSLPHTAHTKYNRIDAEVRNEISDNQ